MKKILLVMGITVCLGAKPLDWAKKKVIDPSAKGLKIVGGALEGGAKKVATVIKQEAIDPLIASFQSLDHWVLPDARLRFDQVAYLGAHNAYANYHEGFMVAEQQWGITDQLKRGVRQFLLDIWPDQGELLLCHTACSSKSSKLIHVGKKHASFKKYLEIIKNFLDGHPQEIISLELENYASQEQTAVAINSVPGLKKYLLTPATYNPLNHEGQWPTLQQLISKNKRLIIFDTGHVSKYGFNTNNYLIRNQYGTHDIEKACKLREASLSKRTLWQLSYFGTVPSPLPVHNTPSVLEKVIQKCQKNGIVPPGKAPNFIVLDFVDRGNPMRLINALNKKAAQELLPKATKKKGE